MASANPAGTAVVAVAECSERADGLRVRLHNRAGAVEYHLAGHLLTESFAIPLTVLVACEGTRADQPGILESRADGHFVLHWDDQSVHDQPEALALDEASSLIGEFG